MIRYVDRNGKLIGKSDDEAGKYIMNSLIPRKALVQGDRERTVEVDVSEEELVAGLPRQYFDMEELRPGTSYIYVRQDGFLRRMIMEFPLNLANSGYLTDLLPDVHSRYYILFIVYKDDMDAQLGVTGGVKQGESASRAAKREVSEETGILLQSVTSHSTYNSSTKKWSRYLGKVTENATNGLIRDIKPDSKRDKVAVLVYGELSVLDSLLRDKEDKLQEDGILCLAIVPRSSL